MASPPNRSRPATEHLLGTTEGQYDIYYGVIWGTRTAFRVGVVITLFTTIIGLLVGSLAAFYGGWLDELLMRITEIFLAFPFLLAAITLTSVLQTIYGRGEAGPLMFMAKVLALFTFGQSLSKAVDPVQMQILTGMLAIIGFGWMTYARVIRGNILAVKEFEYAVAARTIGAGHMRILFRHLMPNAVFPVLVMASMDIGSYVLTFAALSFLGPRRPAGLRRLGADDQLRPQLDPIAGGELVDRRLSPGWPSSCLCWPGTWWAMLCATFWTHA